MENADAPNTGHLARTAPDSLDDVRKTDVGAKILTQIVEGPAGLALAGTLDGRVVALAANGETAWEADVPGPVRTAPAWDGQHILVMPRAKQAVALTPAGETAWTLPVENERSGASLVRMASPAIHTSGDAILADMQGTVYRVATDGSVVWTHDVGGERAVEATPAITPQGHVLVASFVPGTEGAGQLALLDGKTGEPIWTKGIGSQVVGAPALVGDLILLPLRDGDAVQGRALQDGSLRWSVTYDNHVTSSPTVYRGLAIAGDIRGVVRGIDIESGDVAWRFSALEQEGGLGDLAAGTVQTVADSAAIDRDGGVWLPIWNARMATCCPPSDSGESPFYLLDAETGDPIDSTRFDKAAHGPSLHASGVWAGTDHHKVLRWSTGPTLQAEAFADGTEVTLVVNTDRAGVWSIDTGTSEATKGAGTPPIVSTHTLDPGRHTITVTVGDTSTTATVRTTEDPTGGAEDGSTTGAEGTGDGATTTDGPDDETPGPTGDGEAAEPTRSDGTEDDPLDEVPVPGLAALIALALAAGRRRRG